MNRIMSCAAALAIMLAGFSLPSRGGDPGLFRTRLADAPDRGILRMSSTSFYTDIPINSILSTHYGVGNSRIFSSVTQFELGVTEWLTVDGNLPYYMDMFKQRSRSGEKTGAGDVVLGLRVSRNAVESLMTGFSLGGRFRIPEQLGYGPEPLGFRTFSYGKPAYSIDAAASFRLRRMNLNMSASMIQYLRSESPDSAFTSDAFYDTGLGYLGIGQPDETGLATGIFQNQLHFSAGASIPVKQWFTALVEFNATSFAEAPRRDPIMTVTPGIRIGTPEGLNMSLGIDYALGGPVPDKTVLFRFRVPTLSYRGIKALLTHRTLEEQVKSRNAMVAVNDFYRRDISYLYERELRDALLGNLTAGGFLGVTSPQRMADVMSRRDLVPIPEKPQQLGVRLGATYLINAEIIDYRVDRYSNFTVPYLVGFPQTDFTLVCRASVTDLVTGDEHPLGSITATVVKPRGVELFPTGPSSDINYLSEPERRVAEKELVNRWVEQFNEMMIEKSGLFGWEPRRAEVAGDEGAKGTKR
jgi:hypothetical protein